MCLACTAHLVTSTTRTCTILVTAEGTALLVIKRVLISETRRSFVFKRLFSVQSNSISRFVTLLWNNFKNKTKKPQQHEKLLAWFCLPINYPLVEEVGPVVFYHCGRVQFHGSKPHHFIATVLMTHQGKACII